MTDITKSLVTETAMQAFGEQLKAYLKENATIEIRSPSYKDSTMRIVLVIDDEDILEASVWESDIPKERSPW